MQSLEKSVSQPTASIVPQLGLVCVTTSPEVRFRTITRKRLLQFSPSEQEQMLRDLYAENLRRLDVALQFCGREGIKLYRMSSHLFPFADDGIGEAILPEFAPTLRQIGTQAQAMGIRLVLHPEQFVVLNSDRPKVIENSLKILKSYARTLDFMGLPRSPYALMNIHGGKGDRTDRLISVIRDLPDAIRLRLTLENDEYAYSASEILAVCQAADVAMVFDAHHHVIHERLDSYEDPSIAEMVAQARTTWNPPEWQLVHISNGRAFFNDPEHSDLITLMPSAYRDVPWIEIEAKHKEQAITLVRQQWLGS